MAIGSRSKGMSNNTHTATDMFDNVAWFKAKREPIREFCMDQKYSRIWDFVDRASFEKITSPASDPVELSRYGTYITLFYRIATLFYYENSIRNN